MPPGCSRGGRPRSRPGRRPAGRPGRRRRRGRAGTRAGRRARRRRPRASAARPRNRRTPGRGAGGCSRAAGWSRPARRAPQLGQRLLRPPPGEALVVPERLGAEAPEAQRGGGRDDAGEGQEERQRPASGAVLGRCRRGFRSVHPRGGAPAVITGRPRARRRWRRHRSAAPNGHRPDGGREPPGRPGPRRRAGGSARRRPPRSEVAPGSVLAGVARPGSVIVEGDARSGSRLPPGSQRWSACRLALLGATNARRSSLGCAGTRRIDPRRTVRGRPSPSGAGRRATKAVGRPGSAGQSSPRARPRAHTRAPPRPNRRRQACTSGIWPALADGLSSRNDWRTSRDASVRPAARRGRRRPTAR